MKLDKTNLSALCKRRSKIISVNGYDIRIVEMTIPQQLFIETTLKEKKNNEELITPMLKFCVVDDNDQPLFDDENIKELPAAIAVQLFQECINLNSISDKDLENRAKNY